MSPEEEKVKEVMDIVYGKDKKVDVKPEVQEEPEEKQPEIAKEYKKHNLDKDQLIVDVGPHVKDSKTIKTVMYSVIIALVPAIIASVYYFKSKALLIIIASVAAALAAEYIIQKYTKKKITIKDGSAVITGLLLALILPPTVPLWIPILGSIFAVAVAKHAFGGIGHNIFNPALAGRAFLVASWPALMTRWLTPDGITGATPLGLLKEQGIANIPYSSLFSGNIAGCIGETSAIALLIGGAYLLYKKIIDWRIPSAYIGTVIVLGIIFRQDVLFHILAGGLLIGAFFMATDYVTTPITKNGRLVFGFGCGFLTMILRLFSGYPEGVMFSILLMNAATPLIDRFTKPAPFGAEIKKQVDEESSEEERIKKKVDEMLNK